MHAAPDVCISFNEKSYLAMIGLECIKALWNRIEWEEFGEYTTDESTIAAENKQNNYIYIYIYIYICSQNE